MSRNMKNNKAPFGAVQGQVPQLASFQDNEMDPGVPNVEELETPVYIHDLPEFEVIEEEEWAEDEQDDEFYPVLKQTAAFTVPSIACTMAQCAREVMNLYYLCRNGDGSSVLALGLGNILVNTLVVTTNVCIGTSMESLVNQSLATGKLQLCGHHLNRSIIMWTLSFLVLGPLAVFYRYVLAIVGYDEKTQFIVAQYLVCLLPGLFVQGLCEIYRRFFKSFNDARTPMLCYAATLILHPLMLHLLIEKHEMKLLGVASATLLSYLLTYFFLRVRFSRSTEMQPANISPSAQTIFEFN